MKSFIRAGMGVMVAVAALAVPVAQADEALAKTKGCTACHANDKKVIGPAYKEVAKKYKGKADAEAKLTAFLSKGGKIKVDGVEDDHKTVKGGDAAESRSVAVSPAGKSVSMVSVTPAAFHSAVEGA